MREMFWGKEEDAQYFTFMNIVNLSDGEKLVIN